MLSCAASILEESMGDGKKQPSTPPPKQQPPAPAKPASPTHKEYTENDPLRFIVERDA
jgi:hypothetical protein